jgi:hypothetical protein
VKPVMVHRGILSHCEALPAVFSSHLIYLLALDVLTECFHIHCTSSRCDADPGVLADYVIALLKHDQSDEELRSTCVMQLEDFLKEGEQ